jgi:DNA modification methylase
MATLTGDDSMETILRAMSEELAAVEIALYVDGPSGHRRLPAPYYEDDAVTIYHGDCREILPHLPKVDAVVTDPPYGINADLHIAARANRKDGASMAASRDYGRSAWDSNPVDSMLLKMVLDAAPLAIVWGGNYYALPPGSCWLVWDKVNGSNTYADCELAWTSLPGAVRMISYRWHGMLQQHGGHRKEARVHPTQKPVEVMRWCIDRLPTGSRVIVDPFMGSGTTLRAAKDLGLHAIGIEIEERYCEIAAERMGQEVLPL